MKRDYIFLALTGMVFLSIAIVFLCFPRSKYSELERRELKEFPEFSIEKLRSGEFTSELSEWFSDTEPFRDRLMTASMTIKKHLALNRGEGEEQFVFHATGDAGADMIPGGLDDDEQGVADAMAAEGDREISAEAVGAADNEESKMSKSGILVVGKGDHVRALMNYSGSAAACNPYIATVNEYARQLPGVKIYSMVVPIAMEFYCPAAVRNSSGVYKSQLPAINHIYSSLSGEVRPVNVYTTLAEHASEDIYLRTDHHWAPLGAYYAAREFARVAKVHIPELSEFDRNVLSGFVGTMYGYSKDISVKNAPEDFVYYTPKNQNYTSWFTIFDIDKEFRVTGAGREHKSSFFKKFKNGSGNAYLTFMGSDFVKVKVETGVKNGRRLAILKDSYGNALPGYLFGSFEDVHVLDFRYFPYNIVEYCKANGITDFLFVNNIFNASSGGVAAKERSLLTRSGFAVAAPVKTDKDTDEKSANPSNPASPINTSNPSSPINTSNPSSPATPVNSSTEIPSSSAPSAPSAPSAEDPGNTPDKGSQTTTPPDHKSTPEPAPFPSPEK